MTAKGKEFLTDGRNPPTRCMPQSLSAYPARKTARPEGRAVF
jgi:hypothetical protein